jgi:NRPS condensation-like uncharacterized protein
MPSLPLSVLDELFLNLDRDSEPWTVHYELQLGVHLASERLTPAIRTAVQRHPLARARLAPWRFHDRTYHWDVAEHLPDVPLTVVECGDQAALDAARERLFAASPPLDAAPPFAMVLARRPDGDSLMLNLHHAAGDGISAARLMLSVLRAYVAVEDPVPELDPLAVHDVRTFAAARSARERDARRRALASASRRTFSPPTRIAREGVDLAPAYGFQLRSLSREQSQAIVRRAPAPLTVNDVLLAGLAIAVDRWNEEHGRVAGPVALSMPVNLRPAEWRHEIFANYASWVTVWVFPDDGADLGRVAERVRRRTAAIKTDRLGGLAVDLLRMNSSLTIASKRWAQQLRPLMAHVVVDTASLSNLGRLDVIPSELDRAKAAVWFSPPAQLPLGAAIGAVTLDERLHLTMRYRRAQFDRAAAQRFMRLLSQVLCGCADQRT